MKSRTNLKYVSMGYAQGDAADLTKVDYETIRTNSHPTTGCEASCIMCWLLSSLSVFMQQHLTLLKTAREKRKHCAK